MTWDYLTDVESDTSPGVWYAIKRHPTTGQLGCSCISFKFSPGTAKTCKHIKAYQSDVLTAAFPTAQSQLSIVQHAGETFTFRRAISFEPLTAKSRP